MSTNRGMKRQREEKPEPEASKNESNRIKKKFQRFPEKSLRVLRNWFDEHKDHPYPTPEEKQRLATEANITLTQARYWFKYERSKHKAKLKEVGGQPRNILSNEESCESKWIKKKFQCFPEKSLRVLQNWFDEHKKHPYPTPEEKQRLATEANLTSEQVKYWFLDERCRYKAKFRNIPVQRVKEEENMENLLVRTIPKEHESSVVPLDKVTTMDNATVLPSVIDLNGTNRSREKDEQSNNEWCWLERKAKPLPEQSVRVLEQWSEDHKDHPYVKYEEKRRLAAEANLTLTQVRDWFRYKRRKYDKILKKEGGHPRNHQAEGVKEENKENTMVTTISIEREANVVPLTEMTALPPEIIDLYYTFKQYFPQL